jgi:hypothetical protein
MARVTNRVTPGSGGTTLLSDDAHREIVNDIMNFLKQPSTTHYHVGLKIFNQLVTEMNQQSPGGVVTPLTPGGCQIGYMGHAGYHRCVLASAK